MGGKALQNTVTRRYQADEYYALIPEVRDVLSNAFLRTIAANAIPAYRTKESFGDMDMLYSTMNDVPYTVEQLQRLFKPNEIIKNGDVISLDYKELQIDFIHTPWDRYDYALSYFSWNDCGNLVGKLAHRMGLKHGHQGLFLPLREDNNVYSEVCVNTNHSRTLELVGLSIEQFSAGFDTLEDIFEFIAASPYYHPDQYLLENLNTVAKIRDRKRDTYRKFLEFGERQDRSKYAPYEHRTDKTHFMPHIFRKFPKAKPLFDQEMQAVAAKRMSRDKFNGDLVATITGLRDKELGQFMIFLKNNCYWAEQSYVIYLSSKFIEDSIVRTFKLYSEAKNVIYDDYS